MKVRELIERLEDYDVDQEGDIVISCGRRTREPVIHVENSNIVRNRVVLL